MGLLKIRKFTVSAVTLALYAAQQMRGSSPYLKQMGPPPLRFSLATAAFSFALPPILIERHSLTNSTETAAPKSNSAQTNAVAPPVPSSSSPPNGLPVLPSPESRNNSSGTSSASDMLVVSPQMLTEYFKPGPETTNSANTLILSAPIGFTPPLAKPSSQAIYKNQ